MEPEAFPMVLLRHTLPDGTWHFDWLLATCTLDAAKDAPDVRDVVTLRVTEPVHAPGSIGGTAERLADHRRLYLWFEGEISGNRGRVFRVAAGLWCRRESGPGGFRFTARFEGGDWRGWRLDGGTVSPEEPHCGS
ncbi:MAG: hypothetical protein J0L61_04755 [Planctomycetes bacterium]|nr:hypothetical protein [Planctomycetota bacterium]